MAVRRYRVYPHAVWCEHHGTHHDRTTDPYDYGEPDCKEKDWRNLAVLSEEGEEF